MISMPTTGQESSRPDIRNVSSFCSQPSNMPDTVSSLANLLPLSDAAQTRVPPPKSTAEPMGSTGMDVDEEAPTTYPQAMPPVICNKSGASIHSDPNQGLPPLLRERSRSVTSLFEELRLPQLGTSPGDRRLHASYRSESEELLNGPLASAKKPIPEQKLSVPAGPLIDHSAPFGFLQSNSPSTASTEQDTPLSPQTLKLRAQLSRVRPLLKVPPLSTKSPPSPSHGAFQKPDTAPLDSPTRSPLRLNSSRLLQSVGKGQGYILSCSDTHSLSLNSVSKRLPGSPREWLQPSSPRDNRSTNASTQSLVLESQLGLTLSAKNRSCNHKDSLPCHSLSLANSAWRETRSPEHPRSPLGSPGMPPKSAPYGSGFAGYSERRIDSGSATSSSASAATKLQRKRVLGSQGSSVKSTKMGMACVICRKRKIRCSGDQPCTECDAHARTCEYRPMTRQETRAQRERRLHTRANSRNTSVECEDGMMANAQRRESGDVDSVAMPPNRGQSDTNGSDAEMEWVSNPVTER